jgi:hypothetical protein
MVSASSSASSSFLALVVAVAVVRVAGQGDFVERHLGRQLILQTVGLDEDAVVLFLQPLHLQRHLPPVGAELLVGGLQGWLAVVGIQQRQAGEVPRGFVGIPLSFIPFPPIYGGLAITTWYFGLR